MTDKTVTVNKDSRQFGLPWEQEYGYVEAVRSGDTIRLAGQVGHDEHGSFEVFQTTQAQMRQAYANVARLLEGDGATMENVVDEVLFVTDMGAAFPARAQCRQSVYGGKAIVCSTIVQVARLAFPNLLVEIKCVAVL
ncbi:MAG: Rid family hydrolase [Pseudoxanthomonas sp.]